MLYCLRLTLIDLHNHNNVLRLVFCNTLSFAQKTLVASLARSAHVTRQSRVGSTTSGQTGASSSVTAVVKATGTDLERIKLVSTDVDHVAFRGA